MANSFNVLPVQPIDNMGDSALCHAVPSGQASLRNTFGNQAADSPHTILRKLGIVTANPFAWATLLFHVLHIVGLSAKKQMVRIAAGRIVAGVANFDTFGDLATIKRVRQSMGTPLLPVTHDLAIVPGRRTPCALPLPTLVGMASYNVAPKHFAFGFGTHVMATDEPQRLAFNLAALRVISRCNRGFLSAATAAIAVGDVLRSIMRHVDTFLSRFGHAAGHVECRRCNFLHDPHYTTDGHLLSNRGGVLFPL
jgi:hypothetical protein